MSVTLTLNLDLDHSLLVLAYLQQLKEGKDSAAGRSPKTEAQNALAPVEKALKTKERKGRADAGKPRGPYKKDVTAGGEQSPLQLSPEAVAQVSSPWPIESAPGIPVASTPADGEGGYVASPELAGDQKPASIDEARAALKRLNESDKGGMQACIDALSKFGVSRITSLAEDQYAAFIEAVGAQLGG